jgi:hypothetical protein
MTGTSPRYRRVRGKKNCLGMGYYTLWEADDHLLQIYSRFGIEDYKRFYFADIQAVVVCKTSQGTVMSLALCAFTLLLAFAAVSWADWGPIVFGIPAGVLAVCAIFNIVRGPTCITTITTAVQTENLQSLHRLRNALDFMGRLRLLTHRFQKPAAAVAPGGGRGTPAAQRSGPAGATDRPPRTGPAELSGNPAVHAVRRPAAGAVSRPARGDKP